MGKPTQLKPIGLLTGKYGETVNISHYGLHKVETAREIKVIVVVGGSMNAGKTTAAVSLAHGLWKSGLRVAGIKATGTGAFGDYNAFRDAGIQLVSDFTDAGMASTYRQSIHRIEEGYKLLIANAAAKGAEVAVVELADGIYQHETATLLRSRLLRETISGVLFASPDALGAVAGIHYLKQMGLQALAVSGMVSRSSLATEEVERNVHVPVVSREDLCNPAIVETLIPNLSQLSRAA